MPKTFKSFTTPHIEKFAFIHYDKPLRLCQFSLILKHNYGHKNDKIVKKNQNEDRYIIPHLVKIEYLNLLLLTFSIWRRLNPNLTMVY
jgi:hypothetical protein